MSIYIVPGWTDGSWSRYGDWWGWWIEAPSQWMLDERNAQNAATRSAWETGAKNIVRLYAPTAAHTKQISYSFTGSKAGQEPIADQAPNSVLVAGAVVLTPTGVSAAEALAAAGISTGIAWGAPVAEITAGTLGGVVVVSGAVGAVAGYGIDQIPTLWDGEKLSDYWGDALAGFFRLKPDYSQPSLVRSNDPKLSKEIRNVVTPDIPGGLRNLSRKYGIHPGELSRRFHQIKRRGSTPGPRDNNYIDDETGDVYDGDGEYIGNVINDF